MRTDMKKANRHFSQFFEPPISASIPLCNSNNFVFIKTLSVKYYVKKYQINIRYVKGYCSGYFTGFVFGKLFPISYFAQGYSVKFHKIFRGSRYLSCFPSPKLRIWISNAAF